jgi:hypothetical protein
MLGPVHTARASNAFVLPSDPAAVACFTALQVFRGVYRGQPVAVKVWWGARGL